MFLKNIVLSGDGHAVSLHEDFFLSRQLSSGMIPRDKGLDVEGSPV
jgi:hypothetical protein